MKGAGNIIIKRAVNYFFLFLLSLLTLGPFLWLLIISLKVKGSVFAFPPINTLEELGFKNFLNVTTLFPVWQYFINTLILAIGGAVWQVILSALAGYPLARMEFPGKKIILVLLASILVLPGEANFIVNFITCYKLRLLDTFIGVILPSGITVFGIFIMRQAYILIPREFEDIARVDGCNEWQLWWKVMLPLTKPALATLAVYGFISFWNSFLWPLIVLQTPEKFPLSVALSYLQGTFASNFRVIAAALVLTILPVVILFYFFQQFFLESPLGGDK